MSWSVSAIGKSQAVKTALAEQFGKINCSEPEQTIKNDAATAIARSLSHYPAEMVVKVSAAGSQSEALHYGGKRGEFVNTLTMQIEPQWGFVE